MLPGGPISARRNNPTSRAFLQKACCFTSSDVRPVNLPWRASRTVIQFPPLYCVESLRPVSHTRCSCDEDTPSFLLGSLRDRRIDALTRLVLRTSGTGMNGSKGIKFVTTGTPNAYPNFRRHFQRCQDRRGRIRRRQGNRTVLRRMDNQ